MPTVTDIALVANATVNAPAIATTPPIDTTGASLLVMSVACYDPTATLTIDDSMGNVWVPINIEGTIGVTELFYVANPTVGASHTFTASNAQFITVCVAAFSGVALVSPLDQQSGAQTDATSGISPGPIVATTVNELFVTSYETDRSGTIGVSSAFTITDSQEFVSATSFGAALAFKLSSGTENPLWNADPVTGRESTIMATFLPETGAPIEVITSPGLFPHLLNNGWIAGTPVPTSCSVGISPDFYETVTRTLYSCVAGKYVIAAPPLSGSELVKELFSELPVFANNTAAKTGGLTRGMLYRNNGDPALLCVVK
jgi:hypothetical protein